ncbi:hypothetical protein AB835_02560 [Candidatus Endobugula sertula]|uniref:Toxin n=1 Tax=Candidatus Endobugula sertula TaxID=62101 RepID=A0A1D2QSY2_9GAMM|nr:hypothetical protein AB835_02560 [Candidatus Endobugula sertula]
MENNSQEHIPVSTFNLPKGGGAIRGMGASLGDVGPTGTADYNLPLPISPESGYAPALVLNYSSGGGNDVFGLGWQLPLMVIARRSNRGVPDYDEDDEFVGPDGEVMVPEHDSSGEIISETRNTYGDKALSRSYEVTRYFPRVEGSFQRIEHWIDSVDREQTFWLVHSTDGQLHCLGKTALARTAATVNGRQCIAQWWLEESLSPTGEHIYYTYRAENDANVALSGQEQQRQRGALSYLLQVYYGNTSPAADLYLWDFDSVPALENWLFILVLDYGERSLDSAVPPPYYSGEGQWLARQDAFSGYHYGFETRCHRLCHQVLMYHNISELGATPTLVNRLLLTYAQDPIVSHLVCAQQLAYASDNSPQSLPPLELDYNRFVPLVNTHWQTWEGMKGWNDGQPYQLVDLYGEGLSGILYQVNQAWHYCAPLRDNSLPENPDAVCYDSWQSLPMPSIQAGDTRLLDYNGDGRLDWMVSQPGMTGCFTLNPDHSWSGFTPFTALPKEFFQAKAQLADLIQTGLSDVVLIGPKSVRLYANQRAGFAQGVDVAQDDGINLPIVGRDATTLVAFSDVLGSGQQHLLEVSYNCVKCWPNLGHGRFGAVIEFPLTPLESEPTLFNPQRVYLADIDGSGAADLLYMRYDQLLVYTNQSGNGFAVPIALALPEGVEFDRLCQLTLADLDGNGTTSALLTVPHPQVSHWRYDFCQQKPYLLNGINNNMGASYALTYRSSAQFWLDEKAAESSSVSLLPFPVHTLSKVTLDDEISGNRLIQNYAYYHGYYDGNEREFRGFALVEVLDTDYNTLNAAESIPPILTRSWYHTGREQDTVSLYYSPWQGDTQAFSLADTRLTIWDTVNNQDVLLDTADENTRWWLYRSLKGQLLRQEIYGRDQSALEDIPYSVSQQRHQIRLCQSGTDAAPPVVLPVLLEQLDYHYERIIEDPQCSQQLMLAYDVYGQIVWQVTVNYPRRPQPAASPYPDTLPDTSVASSYDEQQTRLRLSEARQAYYHLDSSSAWQLAIPWQTRQNVLEYSTTEVPANGFSIEELTKEDGLLAPTQTRRFAGQEQYFYHTSPPDSLPVLPEHIETAELDDEALAAYEDVLTPEQVDALISQGGYQSVDTCLNPEGVAAQTVWVIPHSFSTYYDETQFYLPETTRSTQLTGELRFTYNQYYLLASSTNVLGSTERVIAWDYRFLQPIHLQDINSNHSVVAMDALGRTIAHWYYGTEGGQDTSVGFTSPAASDLLPDTVTALLQQAAGSEPLTVASRQAYDTYSWMAQISEQALIDIGTDIDLIHQLVAQRVLLPDPVGSTDYRLSATGRRWAQMLVAADSEDQALADLRQLLLNAVRTPPHSALIEADRFPDSSYYPDTQAQQIRAQVMYGDGFARNLQTLSKDEPGLAYQRNNRGELVVNTRDKTSLLEVDTGLSPRWAVSGRVEYNNKGLVVRAYQPYFVNGWHYVVDSALLTNGYADTYFYDAMGRESRVETAKGYLRRTAYYPWFSVAEDENDTFETNGGDR